MSRRRGRSRQDEGEDKNDKIVTTVIDTTILAALVTALTVDIKNRVSNTATP